MNHLKAFDFSRHRISLLGVQVPSFPGQEDAKC